MPSFNQVKFSRDMRDNCVDNNDIHYICDVSD